MRSLGTEPGFVGDVGGVGTGFWGRAGGAGKPSRDTGNAPGAVPGVEHGAIGMPDQQARCHGFEPGDFYFVYFLSFAVPDAVN